MFWKKKEIPTTNPVTEYDILDKLEMYARQLVSDHNFGIINDEEYEREAERIRQGVNKIRSLLPDPEFNRKVQEVIDSIWNERTD